MSGIEIGGDTLVYSDERSCNLVISEEKKESCIEMETGLHWNLMGRKDGVKLIRSDLKEIRYPIQDKYFIFGGSFNKYVKKFKVVSRYRCAEVNAIKECSQFFGLVRAKEYYVGYQYSDDNIEALIQLLMRLYASLAYYSERNGIGELHCDALRQLYFNYLMSDEIKFVKRLMTAVEIGTLTDSVKKIKNFQATSMILRIVHLLSGTISQVSLSTGEREESVNNCIMLSKAVTKLKLMPLSNHYDESVLYDDWRKVDMAFCDPVNRVKISLMSQEIVIFKPTVNEMLEDTFLFFFPIDCVTSVDQYLIEKLKDIPPKVVVRNHQLLYSMGGKEYVPGPTTYGKISHYYSYSGGYTFMMVNQDVTVEGNGTIKNVVSNLIGKTKVKIQQFKSHYCLKGFASKINIDNLKVIEQQGVPLFVDMVRPTGKEIKYSCMGKLEGIISTIFIALVNKPPSQQIKRKPKRITKGDNLVTFNDKLKSNKNKKSVQNNGVVKRKGKNVKGYNQKRSMIVSSADPIQVQNQVVKKSIKRKRRVMLSNPQNDQVKRSKIEMHEEDTMEKGSYIRDRSISPMVKRGIPDRDRSISPFRG